MKANEAPLKLYISNNEKYFNEKCHSASTEKYVDNDIEYTRTDAFIEKACEFLKDRIEHDSIDYPMATKHLVEDFKKYMEE